MSPPRSWLAERARISAAKSALEIGGAAVSYAELESKSRAGARRLRALGVGRGDVVAVLLGNGARFVEMLHAVARSGAALLPLNVRLTPRELAHQLRESGARWLLHEQGALAQRATAAASGSDTQLIEVAEGEIVRADVPEPCDRIDPGSPLAVLFTSGTTGAPKGAELTRRNFFWSAAASAFHLGVLPGDRWLACLPFFHVGGLSILLRTTLYGNTTVVHERFDPEAVNDAIDRRGITHVSLVATMLARMLDARGERPAPRQLRCVLLGGGAAPDALVERARALGFPLAPTYGLTEAASQVATRAPGEPAAPGGGGLRPLLGTEVRVVDAEGEEIRDETPGELLVRGPTVMRGYVNRPAETAEALRDGWLHTGDVALRAGDGSLRILERRRDLIISGGENVYPGEVENVLREHPAVADAAVAAVADAAYGQRPAAWLVYRRGATPGDDELRAFCRERLASYKVPIAFHGVAALPRNPAGKLLRHELGGGGTGAD